MNEINKMEEVIKSKIKHRNESIERIRSKRERDILQLKDDINGAKSIVTWLRNTNKSEVLPETHFENICKSSKKYIEKYMKVPLKSKRSTQSNFRSHNNVYNSQMSTYYNSNYTHRRTQSVWNWNSNRRIVQSSQRSVSYIAKSQRGDDLVVKNIEDPIIEPASFSRIIHNEFSKYELNDYANFNYKKLVDENVRLK